MTGGQTGEQRRSRVDARDCRCYFLTTIMSLNRSMQNAWGAKRKSRIDLNGELPLVPTTTDVSTVSPAPEELSTQKRKSRTTHGTSKRAKPSHEPPSTRLADMGGVNDAVEKLLELVALPVCHPEVYLHTGVQPPRGVLLHGPPGCGKTMLANAIAGELGVPFISVSAPSIVSGMSGESEKTLRDTFDEAKVCSCILILFFVVNLNIEKCTLFIIHRRN
jgi:ribosome biogenesis ATPase